MINVFHFKDYRNYLQTYFKEAGERSGIKLRFAQAIRTHNSLISQVLSGRTELTAEQAHLAVKFLGLNAEESDYFMNLVLIERAGTMDLKKYYLDKNKLTLQQQLSLKRKIEKPQELNEEAKVQYYSSFLYSAIFVLSSIPRLQTPESIRKILNIDTKSFNDALQFLIENGLLKEAQGKISPGSTHIHLDNNSRWIGLHHRNWRLATAHHMQKKNLAEDFHYSGILAISNSDAEKIKEILLDSFQKSMKILKESPEEDAYVMCMDFYQLRQEF